MPYLLRLGTPVGKIDRGTVLGFLSRTSDGMWMLSLDGADMPQIGVFKSA